jgi:hypothetical protein
LLSQSLIGTGNFVTLKDYIVGRHFIHHPLDGIPLMNFQGIGNKDQLARIRAHFDFEGGGSRWPGKGQRQGYRQENNRNGP